MIINQCYEVGVILSRLRFLGVSITVLVTTNAVATISS